MEVAGFILAALIGVSLGLIGGGGSILTVPILVYLMGVHPILATSYSLFIVGTTSLVGAVTSYPKGYVHIKTALFFGISSVATVFITRKLIMPLIPPVLFRNGNIVISQSMATMVLFAILMLFSSIAMIRGKNEPEQPGKDMNRKESNFARLLRYGILIGLATGFLGAGGGFLVIPALVLILKMPMKQAVGTSLLIIALNSLIGFSGDIGHFVIHWGFLVTITLVAIAGIFIGGALAKKMDGFKLKKGFGWFVLSMGIYIFIREIFFRR